MSEDSHQGRVALITGASSGVGAHIARLLFAHGAKVVIGARRVDRLHALADSLESARGAATLAVSLDVADDASIIDAYDAAEQRFGTVDTVIANAGVNWEGSALDIPVDELDRILSVNLRGAFLTAREGARRMIAAGVAEGRIVLMASMSATKALPGLAAYGASKAGMVMMGRSMAQEWARHGLCVNSICPGYMMTEITEEWFGSPAGERMISRLPRRRLMPIAALDELVLLLSSDAGRYVTGAGLLADDGQSM